MAVVDLIKQKLVLYSHYHVAWLICLLHLVLKSEWPRYELRYHLNTVVFPVQYVPVL
jgi:hypothetical protein